MHVLSWKVEANTKRGNHSGVWREIRKYCRTGGQIISSDFVGVEENKCAKKYNYKNCDVVKNSTKAFFATCWN